MACHLIHTHHCNCCKYRISRLAMTRRNRVGEWIYCPWTHYHYTDGTVIPKEASDCWGAAAARDPKWTSGGIELTERQLPLGAWGGKYIHTNSRSSWWPPPKAYLINSAAVWVKRRLLSLWRRMKQTGGIFIFHCNAYIGSTLSSGIIITLEGTTEFNFMCVMQRSVLISPHHQYR